MKELFYLLMVLLGVASSAPAQSLPPAQPVPKDIWGHWIVTRQLPASTISCWGEAAAQKLIGTELAYSAQSFRWKNIRTKNPTATTRTLTAQQFHDENSGGGSNSSQVTFAQLGIKTDHVLEVKISHPDAGITEATSEIPGDTVLSRDKNTIIFSVCNIYFEAKPHAAVHK
jgi:hypothetical protein